MATGYSDTYRGTVIDNVDPQGQGKISVNVPDVGGDTPMWASPSDPSQAGQPPAIGADVQITFEGGDSDHPLWQSSAASTAAGGTHQATVISNVDPDQANRLQISLPDVLGDQPAWATPSPSVAGASPPDIGATVLVEFEDGDLSKPVWVGTP